MVREIANDMEIPYMAVSLGGGQRYSQVIGSTVLKDGVSSFEPARWLTLASNGPCVIALEEIAGMDPEVGLGLNQVFERCSRSIELPSGVLNIHPDCRFVGIANGTGREISAQYTGVQRLDDSMLDRFPVILTMDYDPKTEKAISTKYGLTADKTKELQGMVKILRDNVRKSQIMFDPSTRRFIEACSLIADGLTVKESFEMVFLGSLSSSERSKAGF
jgi:MoxR-like ATPase